MKEPGDLHIKSLEISRHPNSQETELDMKVII